MFESIFNIFKKEEVPNNKIDVVDIAKKYLEYRKITYTVLEHITELEKKKHTLTDYKAIPFWRREINNAYNNFGTYSDRWFAYQDLLIKLIPLGSDIQITVDGIHYTFKHTLSFPNGSDYIQVDELKSDN